MKPDEYIDDFIRKEKQEQMNPFLATKIMTELEALDSTINPKKKISVWQYMTVAASIILIMMMGISIGSIGRQTKNHNSISVNINDSQIENLSCYISENYE
ncbi:MAG: hypothetical protein ACYC2P_03235 [Paludibacteraceae bacterium]